MKQSMTGLVSLGLASVLLLAGCGKSDDVLVVGTNASFPPFEYVGGVSGDEIKGFDIDLARQIAKDAGKSLKVENMNFDSLIVALNAGKIDFIASGMTITAERQANVDFSTPYYEATQMVLVNKNNNSINSIDDLKGKHIAVQLGSTGDIMAKTFSKKVTAFNTGFEAVMELKNNKVDLVLFDSEPAISFLNKNPQLKMVELDFEPEFYGLAVPKDKAELLTSINSTLESMKNNGEYDALVTKYMK
ncbi:basic amino acid ABC transporter substrate-binding protein [Shewanella marinintestina]|uniref:basic amino acid ABC transporter substrate-binding protein n=1 Tax=Shewanella marinintestina TaxID=190305 RepID=UPI00200E9C64|nr:basic amino acid ABC transporter substrate-binding protein [Shewanella marinintestina]MCL1146326.1 basic amino acid ABC transporter substrate-binding protein [Shewanella marinintestina]